MERELRITMRYDSLYKHDVDVNCKQLNLTGNCLLQGGYSIALLKEMSIFLKFGLKQVTNVGGYDFANATSQGIDLFVGSYVLRSARLKLVDPTFVTLFSKLVTIFNHEHESINGDILSRPFKPNVWMSIFGLIFLALLTIGVIQDVNVRLFPSNTRINTRDTLFEVIATCLQKGTVAQHFLNGSTRFALCVLSFCFFFVVLLYSGMVVAILSVGQSGITSLDALVKSNYQILLDKGYNNGSSNQVILEDLRDHDGLIDRFLKKASKTKIRFDTFEKSILDVRDKPMALMTEDDTGLGAINSVLGKLPCSWTQISVRNIQYPVCMFMRKGMPYRHEINTMLLKMRERGVMSYLKKKWIHQDESCVRQQTLTTAALSNLSFAFIIAAGGIFGGFLMAGVEKKLGAMKID